MPTPLPPEQQAILDEVVTVALAAERHTGFPAEAVIAQGAAESAWFSRQTGDFNFWGLTRATAPHSTQKLVPTHEVMTEEQFDALPIKEKVTLTGVESVGDGKHRYSLSREFPSFPSLVAAVDCYVTLITTHRRYAACWGVYLTHHNLDELLTGIAATGYATGPGYAAMLTQIANGSRVLQPVEAARLEMPTSTPTPGPIAT